jgi:two-component system, LytTR family, response regulator
MIGAPASLSSRSTPVRTLIVNGEPGMRAHLHRLCANRPDLEVIAAASSGLQAKNLLDERATDLLLVDSRLPDMSGAELLRTLIPTAVPPTIMVTSPQDDVGREPAGIPVRYLYKPIAPPQFNAAVDQAITESLPELDSRLPPQIIGEKSNRIYFLDARTVEYLASAGNYVTTHVGGEQFLTRATLKSMSQMLVPLGFVQIERSLLVNLRQVAHVERRDRGQYCFVTRHGHRLTSSRERSGSLRCLLLGATTPQRR